MEHTNIYQSQFSQPPFEECTMKTKLNFFTLLCGAMLGGCYNSPSNSLFYDLWDTEVVSTQDAIYAMLPQSGML